DGHRHHGRLPQGRAEILAQGHGAPRQGVGADPRRQRQARRPGARRGHLSADGAWQPEGSPHLSGGPPHGPHAWHAGGRDHQDDRDVAQGEARAAIGVVPATDQTGRKRMGANNPRFDLAGKVVVITGGGKGIGKVYTQEFARAGARVVAADIDGQAAQAGETAIVKAGREALGLSTDISEPASVDTFARAALDRFGTIDVLINNASLMSALPRRSWLEIPVDEWDRVMAVNLRGMFLCCRAFVPAMRAQGRGKIVNISSSRVWEGTPNRLHYTTSKAGV